MSRKAMSLQKFADLVPANVRKKLNLGDMQALAGGLLVKEKIHDHFVMVWESEQRLRKWKAANGYCPGATGRPQCMAKANPDDIGRTRRLCVTCRRIQKAYEDPNRDPLVQSRSEYGAIRLSERRAGGK